MRVTGLNFAKPPLHRGKHSFHADVHTYPVRTGPAVAIGPAAYIEPFDTDVFGNGAPVPPPFSRAEYSHDRRTRRDRKMGRPRVAANIDFCGLCQFVKPLQSWLDRDRIADLLPAMTGPTDRIRPGRSRSTTPAGCFPTPIVQFAVFSAATASSPTARWMSIASRAEVSMIPALSDLCSIPVKLELKVVLRHGDVEGLPGKNQLSVMMWIFAGNPTVRLRKIRLAGSRMCPVESESNHLHR